MRRLKSQFWCCMVTGADGFTVRHQTLEEARMEAARLARKERQSVYILEAIVRCDLETAELPVRWELLKEAT